MTHRIDLDPKPKYRGSREPLFTVHHDGKELLRSHQPFYDSCRALNAMGLTGLLEMYGPGLRMSGDIEACAQWAVHDGIRHKHQEVKMGDWSHNMRPRTANSPVPVPLPALAGGR